MKAQSYTQQRLENWETPLEMENFWPLARGPSGVPEGGRSKKGKDSPRAHKRIAGTVAEEVGRGRGGLADLGFARVGPGAEAGRDGP